LLSDLRFSVPIVVSKHKGSVLWNVTLFDKEKGLDVFLKHKKLAVVYWVMDK
jgi:hypothetical protein